MNEIFVARNALLAYLIIRVAGVLDHLGGRHGCTKYRRAEWLVEGRDAVAIARAEVAHHHTVRVEEVGDCHPLLEKLRVGAVAHMRQSALVHLHAHPLAGAHRHRALHHQHVVARAAHGLELVEHRHDARQVGIARVRGRCVNGDEHNL